MSERLRLSLFWMAIAVLTPLSLTVILSMPGLGDHPAKLGAIINHLAPAARHVANAISAVNFDFRGFDTIGEEFMLVAAVTGTVVLLRGSRGEDLEDRPGTVEERRIIRRDEGMVLICRILAPIVLVNGIYVSLHATTTPGGGFQGGVICASAFLLVYFGEGYRPWRAVARSRLMDALEASGALLFILTAALPWFKGLPFATNVLPLGDMKSALSGGSMVVENIGVACAVTGSFVLIFIEFLEETRAFDLDEQERDEQGAGTEQGGAR